MLTKRFASTASGSQSRKIVLVGTGFLASYIARSLVADPRNKIQLVSRHPEKCTLSIRPFLQVYARLSHLGSQILPPKSHDITSPDTAPLQDAMKGADAVVSMVGLLAANARQMKAVQEDGAIRVLEAAKDAGVGRMVLISAIGADKHGATPYQRTKGRAEEAVWRVHPTATVIRPSIVFGPGDSFFTRFATLAKYLPFLPVFGGGVVRFQPVYAGDVARAVEICCRDDPEVVHAVGGKIVEAGGPQVFTYREIMQLVLQYTDKRRPIISLPFWLGMIQGFFLEKLPESIFTLTRDQVRQLKSDNVVASSAHAPLNSYSFEKLLENFSGALPSSAPPGDAALTSVHQSLPGYLSPPGGPESGKRTHGRAARSSIDEVQRLSKNNK